MAGLVLVITLTGSGCAAVEPEKRAYPLALGAGVSENGFVLKYAMPDMSTATGQEKPDEDPISVLTLSGRDFQEIEAVYNRSQEKFLDLGHLEVLILDEQILEEGAREALIGYLKQEEHIGEDVYVFRTNMLGGCFSLERSPKKLHRGISSGNPGEPHIRAAEEGCDSARGISSILSGWNAALASGGMGGR